MKVLADEVLNMFNPPQEEGEEEGEFEAVGKLGNA